VPSGTRSGRAWRLLLGALGVLLVALVVAGAALHRAIVADLPPVEQLLAYRPPTVSRILADDGTVIGEMFVERRYPVPLERVPAHVRLAVLACEDAAFYRHHGVDPASIVRAARANWARGGVVQGGSTITQQVVKQVALSPERSYRRKLKEMVLALGLEWRLDKDRILELYLNQVYFGAGAYGIVAAARVFFDTDVADLTLAQAALLAGLPQAPSRYDPYRSLALARARQRYVLNRMVEEGFVSAIARETALREPLALARRRRPSTFVVAPWYVEHVRRLLEDRLGAAAMRNGLTVHTPLHLDLQRLADEAVRRGVDAIDRRQRTAGTATPLEGALIAIDPATAWVKALVGGVDFRRSQFNRAVQARRQPGSAIKPFLVAAALERGYTPLSAVLDAPIVVGTPEGPWMPHNFEDRYYGRVSLRTALARSLNSASVRLVQKLGVDPVRRSLGRFGFREPLPPHLSLALGSVEVTLLDLVRAYGVFATLGRRFTPVFVTSVTDATGKPVALEDTDAHTEPVLSPAVAYLVTNMMESAVRRGTAHQAQALARPVAAKTGTTNDARDAWFVGFTPELLTGVWVGYDTPRSLGAEATGGRAAGPIWTDFMRRALVDGPPPDFAVPEGVTVVDIDPASGLLAPMGMPSRREVFVTGTEPTRYAELPEPEEPEEAEITQTAAQPDQTAPPP
jgi:penicillin-binding protein 1A